MAIPTPPQNEPQDSKDAKARIMRESLFTTLKNTKNESDSKKKKPKKVSLLSSNYSDMVATAESWKWPSQ